MAGRNPHNLGTPGRMWTLPLTTAIGTHRSSHGKRNCLVRSRLASVGISIILSLARRAAESSSQLNFGCPG